MRFNRLLKYLNVLIGLVVVVIIALILAGSRFVRYRKHQAVIQVPIVNRQPVTRDGLGIPQYQGRRDRTLCSPQTLARPPNRLWQMEIPAGLQRASCRRLSALRPSRWIAKRGGFKSHGLAEEHARALRGGERGILAAYARGGENHFIKSACAPA